MSNADQQKHLAMPRKQPKADKGRRHAAWWALLDVRSATLPERVPPLGLMVDHRIPSLRSGHRGDQVAFTKELLTAPAQLNSWAKGKGKSKGQGQGMKGRQRKRSKSCCQDLVKIHLGIHRLPS